MREKKRKECEIIFDNQGPLIVWKSDLELKLDQVEQLNIDINFWRGFMIGIFCSSLFIIIFMVLLLVIL